MKLSTRSKIVYILHLSRGEWMSISEIRASYETRYGKGINNETIKAAIHENNFLNDNISFSVERRGQKKQPVNVYTIIPEDTHQ